MNSATVRAQDRALTTRRLPLTDASVLASLPLDPQKQIVFSDLSRRWERIVQGDRA